MSPITPAICKQQTNNIPFNLQGNMDNKGSLEREVL